VKHLITTMVVAGTLALAAGAANAESKGEDLAKKDGCLVCHDVAKKKMGPAYKDVAAKFKKDGANADKVVADLKSKDVHKTVKASDGDLKEIAAWILTL
jgi:cytochrome c